MSSDDRRTADSTDPWSPAPAEAAAASAEPRRRGLFITAMVIFGIGVIFTIIAAAAPFVLGRDAPTILFLLAMLFTPVGFLLGLLYAILGSRPPKV